MTLQCALPKLAALIGPEVTEDLMDLVAGSNCSAATSAAAVMPVYQGCCKLDFASIKVGSPLALLV